MKTPSLSDIIGSLYDQGEDLEIEDFEEGDPDNTNVTIPIITTINAAVTYYFSPITKQALARITWSWSAPLMYDEDGNAVNPSDPDIADDLNMDPVADYMFDALAGVGPVSYRSTGGSTSVVTEGHVPGVDVKLTVYAVTRSGINGPTSTYTATVTKDTTPPTAPSTPVLTSAASVVTVTWDGLTNVGGAQPSDYNYTEIYAGTMNPPTVLVGKIFGPGKYSFLATPGDTVYVRLYSYDNVMNQSAASAVASIVVKSVLDDTGLQAALDGKAVIYAQVADPTLSVTVKNGDWWFKLSATVTGQIDNIYQRVAGAWVQNTQNAANTLAALSVVTNNLAANAVTADKILAGEIYSKLTTTGELKADAISTGILSALVTVSGVLRTAETGQRVVMDANGITLFDASDVPITFINTNGESTFNGNVTAKTLEVVGTMQLDAAGNRMLPGSTLILSSTIQAPASVPVVYTQHQYGGCSFVNASGFIGYSNVRGIGRKTDGTFVVATTTNKININNADGSYNSTITTDRQVFEFVVIGNYAYGVFGSSSPVTVWRTNLTTGVSASVNSSATWPAAYGGPVAGHAIGTDGTNLYIYEAASPGPGGKIYQYSIVNLTGDTFSLTYTSQKTHTQSQNVNKPFWRGTFDIGVDSFLISSSTDAKFLTYSTMAESTGNRFNLMNYTSGVVALGYYGSTIWSAWNSGAAFYDGVRLTTGVSQSADFAYTYYDSVGTTHETPRSPKVTNTIYNRSRVSISVPGWSSDTSTVDSVNQIRFYCAKAAGGTMYAQGNNSAGSVLLTNIATSGSTPPASSNFPALTPARILSSDGSLEIAADGGLKINPVKFRNYPIKWTGSLGGTDSATLTASNYKSVKPNTTEESTGEWTPTWDGDCLVMPMKAWVRIVFELVFTADSTTGNRFIGMSKNPGVTTLNSASYPGTGRLIYTKFSPSSDTSGGIVVWEGAVNVGDEIMFLARTTSATKIAGATYETRVFVTIERYLD